MNYDEDIRILCVDDEGNVLKSLKRVFLDDDYEILTASSGEEGIEILKNKQPVQVVISDYRMPGMDGVEFLRTVYDNWPDTVRIVLSGYADTGSVVEAINEGQIYKFIPKPWNDDDLRVTVTNALEKYFLQKHNRKLAKELKEKNMQLQEINRNLEKLVEERTEELVFKNMVMERAQNILNALPVGVAGIDPSGLIVQANRRFADLMGLKFEPIGLPSEEVFPQKLLGFISTLKEPNKEIEGHIILNGREVSIRGVFMKYQNGQRGLIIVISRTDQKE
ncbi:MAG TPA: response regulator [Nitrospirae bacterium]|nr:response regulator [Nitrospirota bacterium]